MKLLSPQTSADKIQSQQTLDLLRTKELNAAADKARKNLANAEADFNATLAKNLEIWAKEEEAHNKRVVEMTKEIEALERRKARAMEPIKAIQKGAEERLGQANIILASAQSREADADELYERLTNQLDALGQREQDVAAREIHVTLMEEGAKKQQETTKLQAQQLSDAIIQLARQKEKADKDLDKRKTAVFLWEQSLKAKELGLNRKEVKLDEGFRLLGDRTALLERNLKRANIPIEKPNK